jgi:hypothetical protein
MVRAKYSVLKKTPTMVLLQDEMGLNDTCLSVTNDAEEVVREINNWFPGIKIYYVDTLGTVDELLHINGRFTDFGHGYISANESDKKIIQETTGL